MRYGVIHFKVNSLYAIRFHFPGPFAYPFKLWKTDPVFDYLTRCIRAPSKSRPDTSLRRYLISRCCSLILPFCASIRSFLRSRWASLLIMREIIIDELVSGLLPRLSWIGGEILVTIGKAMSTSTSSKESFSTTSLCSNASSDNSSGIHSPS
jgi:hypothetical protein